MSRVAHYHAMVTCTELAYRCRETPMLSSGRVELGEDGKCICVHTERGRVRVPLDDSYFVEPLAALLGRAAGAGGEIAIELCGVLKSGRTQLRLRVPSLGNVVTAPGAGLRPLGSGDSVEDGDTDEEQLSHLLQMLGSLGTQVSFITSKLSHLLTPR
ncbi:hypothetical protein T492DRAFT_1116316 [Pavlovales sp. CCMP2436]|nr:hypothetical protein T492DRAFT_1116316 [Pavlovales sp. CCMP2436]